jgi:hypothetical protein
MTDLQAKRLTMAHLRLMGLARVITSLKRDIHLEKEFGIKPAPLARLQKNLESTEWALEKLAQRLQREGGRRS